MLRPSGTSNLAKKSPLAVRPPSLALTYPQAKTPQDILLQEPSAKRKKHLEKTWGFNCTCPLCASPPATLAADDALRLSFKELEGEAISAINARNFPVAIEKLTRLAEGFEEEGLWPLLQDIYQALATVSWFMGEQEEVERYVVPKLDIRDDYGRLEVGDRGAELAEEMRWIGRR